MPLSPFRRLRPTWLLLLALAVTFQACSDSDPGAIDDSDTASAADVTSEVGDPDAGESEAGETDAAEPDADPLDVADAADPDADAGAGDTSTPDAELDAELDATDPGPQPPDWFDPQPPLERSPHGEWRYVPVEGAV